MANYQNNILEDYIKINNIQVDINYQLIFYILNYNSSTKIKIKELTSIKSSNFQLRHSLSSTEIYNTINILYHALKVNIHNNNKSYISSLQGIIETFKILLQRIDSPYSKINSLEQEIQKDERNKLISLCQEVEKTLLLVAVNLNLNDIELDMDINLNENDIVDDNDVYQNLDNREKLNMKEFNKMLNENDMVLIKVLLDKAHDEITKKLKKSEFDIIFISKDLFLDLLKFPLHINEFEIFLLYSIYVFKSNLFHNYLNESKSLKQLILQNKPSIKYFRYMNSFYQKYFKFSFSIYKITFANSLKEKNLKEDEFLLLRDDFFDVVNFIKNSFSKEFSKDCLVRLFDILCLEKRCLEAYIVISNIDFDNNFEESCLKNLSYLKLYLISKKYLEAHSLFAKYITEIDLHLILGNYKSDDEINEVKALRIKRLIVDSILFYFTVIISNNEYKNFVLNCSFEVKNKLAYLINNSSEDHFREGYYRINHFNFDGDLTLKTVLGLLRASFIPTNLSYVEEKELNLDSKLLKYFNLAEK